jgi:hypothetical protein
MSSGVLDLLGAYFSEELTEERPMMRSSLHNGGTAGVEATKVQFKALLTERTITRDEFYRATLAYFSADEKLYRELADAYRFFFDEDPPTVQPGDLPMSSCQPAPKPRSAATGRRCASPAEPQVEGEQ